MLSVPSEPQPNDRLPAGGLAGGCGVSRSLSATNELPARASPAATRSGAELPTDDAVATRGFAARRHAGRQRRDPAGLDRDAAGDRVLPGGACSAGGWTPRPWASGTWPSASSTWRRRSRCWRCPARSAATSSIIRQRGQLRTLLARTAVATAVLVSLSAAAIACVPRWFSELIFGTPDEVVTVWLVAGSLLAVVAFHFFVSLYERPAARSG